MLSRDEEDDYAARIGMLCDAAAKARAEHATKLLAATDSDGINAIQEEGAPVKLSGPTAALWEEFKQLAVRATRTFVREPLTLRVRLMQAIFLGLLVGIFYYHLTTDVVGIKDRTGALFFVLTAQIMPPALGYVLVCTWTVGEPTR